MLTSSLSVVIYVGIVWKVEDDWWVERFIPQVAGTCVDKGREPITGHTICYTHTHTHKNIEYHMINII